MKKNLTEASFSNPNASVETHFRSIIKLDLMNKKWNCYKKILVCFIKMVLMRFTWHQNISYIR